MVKLSDHCSRRLKRFWKRPQELQEQKLSRDELLLKLGPAKADAGTSSRLVEIHVPSPQQEVNPQTFTFFLRKEKLRAAMRHEGHYLLRSNLCGQDPALLWQQYVLLTEIEAAFRNLKGDLALRPIFHLRRPAHRGPHLRGLSRLLFACHFAATVASFGSGGNAARAVIEKLSAIQMVDVYLPTTDGRILILPGYTQPEQAHMLLLQRLHLDLPMQPPPRICQPEALAM